jgi:hypothetical protein
LDTAADHVRRSFSVAYSVVTLEAAAAALVALPAERAVVRAVGPAVGLQQEEEALLAQALP